MTIDKHRLIGSIISKLNNQTDEQLTSLDEWLSSGESEEANVIFAANLVLKVEDKDVEFVCGKTERPIKPPTS
jgi:hypothetical protein